MQNTLIQLNNEEILQYMIEHNKIAIVDTQMQIENMKKKEYLKMHNHNVWQAKDGKWKTYLDDANAARGYILKVRNTKEALEETIAEYYRDKEYDPYIDQVFETWNRQRLEYGEISKQSFNRYANDFKRFFPKDCPLRQKKMRLITESDLEAFIKSSIRKFNMSAKTYGGMRTIIRGTFKYGKQNHFTNISITTFFGDLDLSRRVFKKRVVQKEKEIFNEDELILVTTYLRNRAAIRDLGILLAFETGVRVGELSALKKEDISKNKRILHVQRTEITYTDPETNQRVCEVRDFPKSEAGDRYLIIPDSAVKTLDAILALNRNGEYLFSEYGKRIRGNAFNRRLTRVCDELHIPHRSMHKIRKTYGTTLIDKNVNESLIAEQMGHRDIATTKKYYYFSNKNEDTKYEQINRAISC